MRTTGRSRAARRSRAGISLLDVTVGIVVLLVGVLSYVQSLVSIERMQMRTLEAGRATQAARAVLEALQAEAFPEAFRSYNGEPADDPGGAGTAPGSAFDVEGLTAQRGDPDGRCGEVVFPTLDGAPGVLREDVAFAQLGMPRDLNGDLGIDAADHSMNYRILPVLVRVRWQGPAGPTEILLRTIVGNY
jgi:hypothetical protein